MSAPVTTSPQARPGQTMVRAGRRAVSAAAALAALTVVGAAALLDLRPPAPQPADAPADRFSAERAYDHTRVIAAQTHVAGSPANDRVRDYLVQTLRGLGQGDGDAGTTADDGARLLVEVQDAVAPEAGQLSGAAGGHTLARVRNVVAHLPGSDPTGRVLLVAHYDSVQVGPGGNDDAAGTAAILEIARALTSGPRPRNDIVFVLTDAEEACLCGAAGFVADHPLAADGGAVLNVEARGSTGPVIMFETSHDNAALAALFGRTAPHPIGTSFAVEIYRLLPNDTDFTAFLADGDFVGLNSAYIDGSAVYHTPLDTPDAIDRRTLQQLGDNTLALARELAAVDLTTLHATGDATYFPVPGGLARYPGWLTWPLAGLALVAVAALAWLARRRGRTSWPRLAAGFGLAIVPIVAAPVAAWLLWAAITAIRPGYAAMLDPYRPGWYRLAVLALTAAVLFTWYALTRRQLGPAALAIGGLGWLALAGLGLAAATPGGAYLATLPALAGALGGLAASLAARPDRPWPVAAVTAGTAVAVVVLLPTIVLLFPALGMAMGGAAALLASWLGLAALPVIELLYPDRQRALPPASAPASIAASEPAPTSDPSPGASDEPGPRLSGRWRSALPTVAAGLAAATFAGIGLAVDRFDADHPVPTHLMYALDVDSGTARWLSRETDPQPWTAQYVGGFTDIADFPGLGVLELRAGPAPAAALPAPKLETITDEPADDRRVLRLRLTPQRPVRLMSLHVAAESAQVLEATVAGHPVPVRSLQPPADRWAFGLVFHAPPTEGIEIELVLTPTDGPVTLRVMDGSDGLEGLPGFRPRPPDVGVAGSHSSELVAVARTYRL